jgi:TonB family protein
MLKCAASVAILAIFCFPAFSKLPVDPCYDSYKEQKILAMGAIDKPKAIGSCEPVWPEKKAIKGMIVIEVIINDKGAIACARVLHSSIKDPAYSQAALDAASKCSFTVPRDKKGNAVWVYHIIQYGVSS